MLSFHSSYHLIRLHSFLSVSNIFQRYNSSFHQKGKNLARKLRRQAERDELKRKKSQVNDEQRLRSTEQNVKQMWNQTSFETALSKLLPKTWLHGVSNIIIHKSYRNPLLTRVALAIILCIAALNDNISPYVMDKSIGPSMLPTFYPIGDIFLRETNAWSKFLHFPIQFRKGDIVVFQDESGRLAVKRIIGIEGDTVQRYGEYVHLFLDRSDWGIPDSLRELKTPFEDDNQSGSTDPFSKFDVPSNHIWLEGDNPLFSVDSRHYGPIPKDSIRGRIVTKIWPMDKKRITGNRPKPLTEKEVLSGKYNVYLLT
jgi:signal peptidase I